MKVQNPKYQQSRREFFTKLALASLATSLPLTFSSCSEKPKFQGSGKGPYKVWEELLHYLKTSPDYLKGRMEKLIAEGNVEAMFHFVRDEFHLIPANNKGIGGGNQLRWGVEYALRSGMATMWEKAELLNQMFIKAGIPSEIVFERTDITQEQAPDFFFRPIKRDFLPEISEGMLRHWAKELQVEETELPLNNTLENEVEEAKELGKKILETLNLPENHYYQKFDFRWPNHRTPTLKFQLNGATKFAHLFDPKVPFGALLGGAEGKIAKVDKSKANDEKVSIKLSYRDSITPLKEKELINGEWLAADLVGRQLDVQFLNNLSLEEMALIPAGNVTTFTPALALQAMDKDQQFMEERSVIGTPITLTGKKIELVDGDSFKVGDATLLQNTDANRIKQVETLTIGARTMGYPGVKLSVMPKDINGEVVEGLKANDFIILEDGKPIKALMENNQRTPRILIMADTSMSMPTEYRGAGMEAFIANLKSDILKKYPAAIIQNWETPSSLFTWLLKASQTENDLVIYATDGDNSDSYNSKNVSIYKSGPPALILNVYKSTSQYKVDTFEKMAEISGGKHLPIDNQADALKQISYHLETVQIPPYTFTYNSVGSANEREVTVDLDKKRLSAKTAYSFEKISGIDQIGPRLIGLYLEIKYTNQPKIKRVLAGWEYDIHPRAQPSQKMANEVNDLMLGSMQFYFEGAGPTFSATITDLLQARLSTRSWGEPLFDNDILKAKGAFKQGQFCIDDRALALMAPLKEATTADSFTIPGGLRIGLRTFKPGVMVHTTFNMFDYLNASEYHTISRDAKKGFKITLQKTAQLAIREKAMFQESTLSELNNKEWINLKEARKDKWFAEHTEKNTYYWRERVDRNAHLRIFDQNAISKAFWNIDNKTGELYGYLENGSGGGNDPSHDDIMDGLAMIIEIMNKLKFLHPIGATALGIVAEYGKTLVKLYAIVSETMLIMDATGMNEKIAAELKAFACTTFKSIIFSSGGKSGEKMAGLDKFIATINGGKGLGCGF